MAMRASRRRPSALRRRGRSAGTSTATSSTRTKAARIGVSPKAPALMAPCLAKRAASPGRGTNSSARNAAQAKTVIAIAPAGSGCPRGASSSGMVTSAVAPRLLRAQRGEDGARGLALVQRIEMDPGRAALQEVGALQRRPGHAELQRRVVIVAPRAQRRRQLGRDVRAAHGGEAL